MGYFKNSCTVLWDQGNLLTNKKQLQIQNSLPAAFFPALFTSPNLKNSVYVSNFDWFI